VRNAAAAATWAVVIQVAVALVVVVQMAVTLMAVTCGAEAGPSMARPTILGGLIIES
jgi:hypothetical protein